MRFSDKQVSKVTLLTRTKTYDEQNQEIDTWAADTSKFPSGQFYIEWWDQGGRETIDGQEVAIKDVRGKCLFISGLNESDYRIRKDSKDYDIENVKEMNGNEFQILMLKYVNNA